jgi:hypothetical protein
MFSEENILTYCELCKKCEEVEKCPVKADLYSPQITSSLIPKSAIVNADGRRKTLFSHIGKCNFKSKELWGGLEELSRSVFKVRLDS